MNRAALIGVTFLVALTLGACDSSDDDSGDGDMGATTGADTGGMASGDFAAIVALGDGDEPLALDAATLGNDLGALFGDGTAEPVAIEDGDTPQSLTQRRRTLATYQ